MFPECVCFGAAPGRAEAASVGTGVVDLAVEDEGELARCGAGWCRSGAGTWTSVGVAVSPGPPHVVAVRVNGGSAPGSLEPPIHGAGGVGLPHKLKWKDTGSPNHSSTNGLAAGAGGC